MQPLISIYTQVYNTRRFLSKCIDSVLNQTYSDFEYIIIDNGSTDGCKEMLEQYAARDNRIKLYRHDKNRVTPLWEEYAWKVGTGKYVAEIDSDDWLETTFFDRLLQFAESEDLDIVCTGTRFHFEGREDVDAGARGLPQRLVMGKMDFSAYFPYYHALFRSVWGKLIRRSVYMQADLSIIDREGIKNGSDTLSSFAWLRQSKRVGIDNSVLHHYLIRNKSVSRIYLPNRFKSNVVLHRDAVDFLSQYGPISQQNRHFLHIVYANAVSDTLDVLWTSDLSPAEKLKEYCNIASHPVTVEAYADEDEAISNSRGKLWNQLMSVLEAAPPEDEALARAMSALAPKCAAAVASEWAGLYKVDPKMQDALRRDDPDALALRTLELIEGRHYTKQYDLGKLMRVLAGGKLLLSQLGEVRFIRKYRSIYWKLWQDKTVEALEEMTGLLLKNHAKVEEETFLQLYISTAAYLEEVPAFLFGKMMQAGYYLRQGQAGACRAVLDELDEMGVEDNDTLEEIRRGLAALG